MAQHLLEDSLEKNNEQERPVLIAGRTGTLGQAFENICKARGIHYVMTSREDMDIANLSSVEQKLEEIQPWAVINATGYVDLDGAESDSRTCFRENTLGNIILADACKRREIKLLTFSTDLVFDGKKDSPYVESDAVAPLNIYGRSKVRAERCVSQILSSSLIIRTGAFFGPWDTKNFLTRMLREISQGNMFFAAQDAVISPTYVPDLVHASLDLLIDNESGLWHLANRGSINWLEFARMAAGFAGGDTKLIIPRSSADFNFSAPRPLYTPLASEKSAIMPAMEDALARYMHERHMSGTAGYGLKERLVV